MEIKNLKNVNEVVFHDYSQFVEGKGNNGGCYAFYTVYRRNGKHFEVHYETSSEFQYCPICGTFGACCCKEDDIEIVSESELIEIINQFEETDDEYFEMK